jgi:hypothetical protein
VWVWISGRDAAATLLVAALSSASDIFTGAMSLLLKFATLGTSLSDWGKY